MSYRPGDEVDAPSAIAGEAPVGHAFEEAARGAQHPEEVAGTAAPSASSSCCWGEGSPWERRFAEEATEDLSKAPLERCHRPRHSGLCHGGHLPRLGEAAGLLVEWPSSRRSC